MIEDDIYALITSRVLNWYSDHQIVYCLNVGDRGWKPALETCQLADQYSWALTGKRRRFLKGEHRG